MLGEFQSHAQFRSRGLRASKSQQKIPEASQTLPNRPLREFRESGSSPSSNRSSRPSCHPLWPTCRGRSPRAQLPESKRTPGSSQPCSCDDGSEYCRTPPRSRPSPKERTRRRPSARTKTRSPADTPARQAPFADCGFCDSRSTEKLGSMIIHPARLARAKVVDPL